MKKFYNEGGINGIGDRPVDTTSEDFQVLKEKIAAIVAKRSPEELLRNRVLGLRFRMMSYLENKNPDLIVSSGTFLKELVQLTGIKSKDFANYINYEATNLSSIYNGRRKISIDLALKLEQIFKSPAPLWLRIQSKNEMLQVKSLETELGIFSLEGSLKLAS